MLLLREWREWRGMTREELAVKVGTTYATIANLEVGRHEPRVSLAGNLAQALGVTLTDIRWGTDESDIQLAKATYLIAVEHPDREDVVQAEAELVETMRRHGYPNEDITQTLAFLRDFAGHKRQPR